MSKKYIGAIILAMLFSVTAGMVYLETAAETKTESDDARATINLRIQEDNQDNTWRVRGNNGRNMGTINSNRSDEDQINWLAIQSDMVFSFDKDVNDYFTFSDSLFTDGYTQRLNTNDMLQLTVRADAPRDTLIYNVFVIDAQKYVVGNSPPKIVILGGI